MFYYLNGMDKHEFPLFYRGKNYNFIRTILQYPMSHVRFLLVGEMVWAGKKVWAGFLLLFFISTAIQLCFIMTGNTGIICEQQRA